MSTDDTLATGTTPLPSRTGGTVHAVVGVEHDGSMTVLSRAEHGSRSAHRDAAQRHFGTALWCMNRLSWVNRHGVRVTLTRWNTQSFRTAKVAA